MSTLCLVPITLKRAKDFVAAVHRHHPPPHGALFAIGARDSAGAVQLNAVVIVGRPVARMLDDGSTVEVTRLASDGTRNACSVLYGAAWRAARAMGYRRAITYTLVEEIGTTLKASGWRRVGETRGGSWNRPSRGRIDKAPTTPKVRWEVCS